MLAFAPVDAGCIARIRPYFDHQCCRSCDYTVGVTYMWRDYFKAAYAISGDMLYLKMLYPDGAFYHLVPVGPHDVCAALAQIEPGGDGLRRFTAIPEKALPLLEKHFGKPAQLIEERRWADYIYPREALSTYAGRKLSGQRNHVNHFMHQYGGYQTLPLTRDAVPLAEDFLLTRRGELCREDALAQAEYNYTLDTLHHIDALGYTGIILRLPDGTPIGLSMGETVGDTLYVHVEKALHTVAGAAQLLCREYAAAAPAHVQYVNREDDMGQEGLRRAKLALHPCEILAKYTAVYAA